MEINEVNKYLFHYRKKLYTPKGTTFGVKAEFIKTMIAEFSALGFTLNKELIDIISSKDIKSAKIFFNETFSLLKLITGNNYHYEPLFKNFPNHLENNEFILKKITAFVNKEKSLNNPFVMDCGHLIARGESELPPEECPICSLIKEVNKEISKKDPMKEYTQLKVLSFGDKEELKDIFTNLLSSQVLFSPFDRDFIKTMINENGIDIVNYLPKEVPKKENLIYISALLLNKDISPEKFISFYKTATDVLRLAVFLSSGSTSLSNKDKFKLKRQYRTLVLILLENIPNPKEDLFRYKNKWLKLAHCLHIGEYQNKFPNSFKNLNELRNSKEKFRSFSSKINTLLSENKLEETLILLQTRPGEFLRRIDFLLRNNPSEIVLSSFSKVLTSLSSYNLLSLRKFIQNRNQKSSKRFFVLQKDSQIKYLEEDNREVLSNEVIQKMNKIIEDELIHRFSKEEKWENVFLDEKLKNILVPFKTKDSNYSILNMTKGSRIKLEDKEFLRMFCYWHETPESGTNIDLDLSVLGLNSDFVKLADVSFHNLTDSGATHSGDIRSAPNGASEFIDIPISLWKEKEIRYIVMSLHSYSGQAFKLYNASAGVMQRSEPWLGSHFEARTVKNRFNLSSDSRMSIPLIIDLELMEMIWADVSIQQKQDFGLSTMNTSRSMNNLLQVILSLKENKPSLYDLLELHCKARAKNILKELNEEDLEENSNIKVFNTEITKKMDEIMSNFLK